MQDPRLRSIPFLAGLGDEDLERIEAATVERRIAAGEDLFAEGDDGRHAYVIVEGELEILKRSGDREVLLAVRGPGDVVGEMSLLEDAPRMAGARARSDTLMLEVPKVVFDELLETSPAAARSLFEALLARWRETEARLRQREQMAQLGTLSAGLAHELNNPAAAAQRAAARFESAALSLADATAALQATGAPGSLVPVIDRIAAAPRRQLGSLARSDREEELIRRLERMGVQNATSLAGTLGAADGDVVDGSLDELAGFGDRIAAAAITVAVARREVAELAALALDATSRISEIVGAVKSYAFTGQSPVQEVRLSRMLDDTLVLLAHKLADIEVTRDYGEVPPIQAFGSELNQVWANLIDNAVDAIREADREPGRIVVRTRSADGWVIVEVEDDGCGIPAHVVPRVFDSFFTTKPPGSGTGLGLNISYGIVTHRHGGEIEIDSEPGRTTVRVRLPMTVPGR
jgi:signal transduction histidine kinase